MRANVVWPSLSDAKISPNSPCLGTADHFSSGDTASFRAAVYTLPG
jgi:hypothetical protein